MKLAEIRKAFIDFYAAKQHHIVESSSLVPINDPTLLFTNAGMNQFKDVFVGKEQREYTRACSTQRVVRAGGKHNDLDNVGYTARHHTFFEMLGNFSFGDYFKKEAIEFAWEFLTEVLELPPEKLWVTVYKDDKEAERIWLEDMGIDPARFSRLDEDNFWSMGDTGPCGSSTEIFFDHGEHIAGGPPGSPNDDEDRYIEIWNLVFMQYDRQQDGELLPLPKPSVDTGMGLERLAAILQKVHSNYEIDLFVNLIEAVAKVCDCKDLQNNSLKVIADHIRSCSFLIADGVIPSNEGRGYVLRRIIRRAVRHGHALGVKDLFFYKIVDALIVEMGDAYPVIVANKAQVVKMLKSEEEQFVRTLDQGMKILEAEIAALSSKQIPGTIIFKLYDTYGFPADLTADIAREKGLAMDMDGFDVEMAKQKAMAKSASSFSSLSEELKGLPAEATRFLGYQNLQSEVAVSQLYQGADQVTEISAGEEGIVVLDQSPFYGESGGQVGDTGIIRDKEVVLEVVNTLKQNNVILHQVVVKQGTVKIGAKLSAEVLTENRVRIAAHHSATHLLHAALKEIAGSEVNQKGSLVDKDKLRFDFSYGEALSKEQLKALEVLVNENISDNSEIVTEVMDIESAKASGAMALFGEKYDADVRVLTMGSLTAENESFSKELCGGTHAKRTGDLGIFKITSESAVSAGIRRIEAVSGQAAYELIADEGQQLAAVAALMKTDKRRTLESVKGLSEKSRAQEKEIERLKSKLAASQGDDLLDQVMVVSDIKVLAVKVESDAKSLRTSLDQIKNKMGSGIVVLAAVNDAKVNLIAGVTKDLIPQYKAGDLVKYLAEQLGGKGGGRPDMAQAGASDVAGLEKALATVGTWVESGAG